MEFRSLLGTFAKLRKATKLLGVCAPVFPHGTTRFPLEGFALNFIFAYFWKKTVEKFQGSLKSDKNNEYFT
jgi:hypothetical protein